MINSIDQTQRNAARAVGFAYIVTNALAWFAEFHVRARLIDYQSAAITAANIISSENLFRLGLAADLLTFALDVIIVVGTYLILRPVNRSLAIFGLAWRLVETAVVAVMALNTFQILTLLSDSAYVRALPADYLHSMVGMAIDAHNAGYNVGFLFFGLGSGAFCLAWYQSRYIPRALAAWGILGSLLAAASTFVYTLSPALTRIVEPRCFVPIGTFELILGFWLLLKGLPRAPSAATQTGLAQTP
jgi:Domain of unknown function (DUF4386)